MSTPLLRRVLIGELTWRRWVRSLLLIYLFFAGYVFWRADSMIFLPPAASYEDTSEIVKLPVTETEQISALHLPHPTATHTLLYIHGNAEDLGYVRPYLEQLNRWGFSVFAYDYRGYGTSEGSPSERNAYQEARAAYDYLTQDLNVPAEQIIVYGRSVGGGSATDLAANVPVAGLILESTFTSAFRVVVPIPLLPFDKFPNRRKLQAVRCPVLIIHGQADQTVPPHHGKALYEAAPDPKRNLWVAEAGHNDLSWVAGDQLRQSLQSFQELVASQ